MLPRAPPSCRHHPLPSAGRRGRLPPPSQSIMMFFNFPMFWLVATMATQMPAPPAPTRTPPRSNGDMYLTDTDEAGYTGNGVAAHGKPAELRAGHPVFRIFCEMYSIGRKLRTFTTNQQQRGRAPRRASSVLLLGFSVPLPVTVGGALFCRPGRAPSEEKHGAADKRG